MLLEEGDYFAARDLLTRPHLEALFNQMPREQQLAWRGKRADLFSLLGEDESATLEYIALSNLQASPADITASTAKICPLLIEPPGTKLTTLETDPNGRTTKTWDSPPLRGRG